MSPEPSPHAAREILWPSVITVISAAILISAEVFGAAFAGGNEDFGDCAHQTSMSAFRCPPSIGI